MSAAAAAAEVVAHAAATGVVRKVKPEKLEAGGGEPGGRGGSRAACIPLHVWSNLSCFLVLFSP
jgi:hypothetical protein